MDRDLSREESSSVLPVDGGALDEVSQISFAARARLNNLAHPHRPAGLALHHLTHALHPPLSSCLSCCLTILHLPVV